ncbi:MAG: IMP cyclohydrolase [Myxococcales bacterium]|nr:IMP cyclohydrolase [Myxococcales bacterium]
MQQMASDNFRRSVVDNSYPGRGIVVGRSDQDDSLVLLYWIMGRSENSRNRRFVAEGGELRTEPVDLSKVTDPSLVIYEAMLERPGVQIVTNGDQTRTIERALADGGRFDEALQTREREPDAPNYTPRISAMVDVRGGEPALWLSILKANVFDPGQTDRSYFRPALPAAGHGLLITTYEGDGDPLPSFVGEPRVVPCEGTAEALLERYWQALDADNRVSLAVKTVAPDGSTRELLLRNRHT